MGQVPGGAFPGIDGFLGTRGSLMLDLVFVAMWLVVPALLVSVYIVRVQRKYELHKYLQLILGSVLLVTVVAFEIDMRLTGWRERAEPSPYWSTWVFPSLYIHLAFAVPTALLWVYVIVRALLEFPNPVRPNAYSASHIFWAWPATIGMIGTAVTGWIFYYLAFVA